MRRGAVLISMLLSALACADTWKAGLAKIDITPESPMWLAGYASRDHESEGALHPLWVKALALEDAAGHRAVLVTSDLLGFPKELSDAVFSRVQEQCGLSRAQVMLTSSHTHSGPVLRDSLYSIYPLGPAHIEKIEAYHARLESQMTDVIGDALKALAPATLASGNGVARFAVNRRTNKEAEVGKLFALQGPSDHAVPVLKVAREDGALLAVVFGYACHATTLDLCKWSGDYPGFAQIEIEAAHPGAVAMFAAGCGADQNPIPRRTVALARQYGRELAAAVDRVLAEPMKPLEPVLIVDHAEPELPLIPPRSRDEFAALAKNNDWVARAARIFLERIDAGQPLPTARSYPIQFWRAGGQTIVALGGEAVVDYAIFTKQMLGIDTFVFGYANDVCAYIPSARVLQEGGYEGDVSQMAYGLPSKWHPDIEANILNTIRTLAAKNGLTPVDAAK